MTNRIILLVFFLVCALHASAQQTFTNPILPSGADPWAIYHEGYYYYTHTLGNRLALWKTKDLTTLKDVTPQNHLDTTVVWPKLQSHLGARATLPRQQMVYILHRH